MATASLNIRLNYSQILELARQLSDEEKLQLNRELAAEVRKIELQSLLRIFKNDEISLDEITSEVEQVRKARYEAKKWDSNYLDTNLWISFLIGRKLSCLLDLLSYPEFQLVVSSELINEVHEVFLRPKFSKYYTSENLDMLIKFMNESAINFSLTNITPRCRDSKDDYLLELALVSKADFLITGDRDLLDMKEIGTCSIVTAMEFDVYSSTIGRPTVLHEGLEEYYKIVIG